MNQFLLKQIGSFLSYKIRKPHRNGHGIHSTFLFSFVTETLLKKNQQQPIILQIEEIRNELLKNKETINIEDLGAGSNRLLQRQRKVADIAAISSSPAKYGILLHNIVSFLKPEIIIELGTCLGIGTMYLASGSEHAKIYSIEGSLPLHVLAKKNLQKLSFMNVFLSNDNFDRVLPLLLKENGKFDLMFIDGNHRKEAVLNYFTLSLPYVSENSVMIIDDIRWSQGMLEAWREICKHEQVSVSLDLLNVGILFFNRKLAKQHLKVYY